MHALNHYLSNKYKAVFDSFRKELNRVHVV